MLGTGMGLEWSSVLGTGMGLEWPKDAEVQLEGKISCTTQLAIIDITLKEVKS